VLAILIAAGDAWGDPSPIVGGTLDTAHPYVAALVRGGAPYCSATIIATRGTDGIAVTAAHCGQPELLVTGSRLDDPTAVRYPVTARVVHPFFRHGLFDVAILRFTGATASTASLDPIGPSTGPVAPGAALAFVGYGQPSTGERLIATGTLARATTSLLEYDQPLAGPCHGDSGGPTLALGSPDVLVGVISSGDRDCAELGASTNLASVIDHFVGPQLVDEPARSCDACKRDAWSSTCADAATRCAANSACARIEACVAACSGDAPDECARACRAEAPEGTALFAELRTCTCGIECPIECAASPECRTEAACGVRASAQTCRACIEAHCCGEALACADDPTCGRCLEDPQAVGCDASEASRAFDACRADACARPCEGRTISPEPGPAVAPDPTGCAASGRGGSGAAIWVLGLLAVLGLRERHRARSRITSTATRRHHGDTHP